MKINFVESFDINESNEYRKYFGQRKLQMSNPKGNLQSLPKDLQDLAQKVIDELKELYPKISFVIHHINGDHTDNDINNLAVIPAIYHDGLFDRVVEKFEERARNSNSRNAYLELKSMRYLIASIEEINNKITELNNVYNTDYKKLE